MLKSPKKIRNFTALDVALRKFSEGLKEIARLKNKKRMRSIINNSLSSSETISLFTSLQLLTKLP